MQDSMQESSPISHGSLDNSLRIDLSMLVSGISVCMDRPQSADGSSYQVISTIVGSWRRLSIVAQEGWSKMR